MTAVCKQARLTGFTRGGDSSVLNGAALLRPRYEQGSLKFIPDEGGKDLFVHFSAMTGSGFKSLTENQAVEFEVQDGQKGPSAVSVRVLPDT